MLYPFASSRAQSDLDNFRIAVAKWVENSIRPTDRKFCPTRTLEQNISLKKRSKKEKRRRRKERKKKKLTKNNLFPSPNWQQCSWVANSHLGKETRLSHKEFTNPNSTISINKNKIS